MPITPFADIYFAPLQAGMTQKDAMYKGRKYGNAYLKVFKRYDWDLYPYILFPVVGGKLNDLFGVKILKWPGAANPEFRLGDNQPFQMIEKEWMKAEDYNKFLTDMTGFLFRNIISRQNTALAPFETLPLASMFASLSSVMSVSMFFIDRKVKKMVKTVNKSLMKMIGVMLGMRKYNNAMKKLGNPVMGMGGMGMAPFDMISDTLRGMRGAMMDMYRHPEELKKACDLLAENQLEAMNAPSPLFGGSDDNTVSLAFMPLHRGADGFMNNKQFEEFYWPGLTKVMEGMIAKGITPMPFFEGRYADRLEYLSEFAKKHKGKLVYWFQDTDIIKVKEKMGDHVCIRGNVPASLLIGGPSKAVEEYVKKCIDGCKEGGGYLVDGAITGIPNEAKHEYVQAMTDAVHEYGWYRK